MNIVAVFLGGVMGGTLRYVVGLIPFGHVAFPYGTGLVNMVGCFALALLYVRVKSLTSPVKPWIISGLGTGVIGSFTTFSTWCTDTAALMHTNPLFAVLNVMGNLILGLAAVYAGHWSGQRISTKQTFRANEMSAS